MAKFVTSKTLKSKLSWDNSQLIKDDIVEEIKKLKKQTGKDILVYGSGELVKTLMQNKLIDEYHILLYPLTLGSGKRLFKKDIANVLHLINSKMFSSGVVALTYKPAKN